MPSVGEITRYPRGYYTNTHVWHACEGCGKERWVPILRGEPKNKNCWACGGLSRKKLTGAPSLGDIYCCRIWAACERCGKERWVSIADEKPRHPLCPTCSGFVRRKDISKPKMGDTYKHRSWQACLDCGFERWVTLDKGGQPRNRRCNKCAPLYRSRRQGKGKFTASGEGYTYIQLRPDDPYFCMARKNGYVAEHRLVVAKRLGRPLLRTEVVHHINHQRDDNQSENLKLMVKHDHEALTIAEARLKRLEKLVSDQEGQIRLLLWCTQQLARRLNADNELTINVRETY